MSNTTDKTLPGNQKKWFYIAFIALNLFLSCYYLDVWLTPNATSRALPVITRYENNTICIDKYQNFTGDKSQINGHYYSDKAPVSSMVVYPFYYALKSAGVNDISEQKLKEYPIYIWENVGMKDGRVFLCPKTSLVFIIGDILCGCLPFLLTIIVTFWVIKNQSYQISPVWLATLPFYGSYLFVYAGTYTGHIMAGFFLFLGYLLLKEKKWFFLSGLVAGLGFATEYPVGIIFPIWVILIYVNEKNIKNALYFIAGVAPGLLFILWYNHHLTGSVVSTSYGYVSNSEYQGVKDLGFSYPKLSAIWGLLFSRYRGVLFYAPALIVLLWYVIKQNSNAIIKTTKKIALKMAKDYFWVTLIFYILLISAHLIWWGGWAYGPRHLIPITLIALYEGLVYLSKKKYSPYFFYIVSSIGLLFAWMDKSTKIYMFPDDPTRFGNPVFDVIVPDFLKHHFNTNMLPVFLFDSSPALAIYAWPILFLGGMILLSRWYARLNPEPVAVPIVKQTKPGKKIKKK